MFDKTGTLTAGRPIVAGITMLQQQPSTPHSNKVPSRGSSGGSSSEADMSPSLMLQLAAAVERHATHPVAKALVAAAAADRNAASVGASSSSGGGQDLLQADLLQERRESHASAGTRSSSSGSKQHHFWQHKHSSNKGGSSSFLTPEAAAVVAASGRLEPDPGSFTQEPGSGAVATVVGHNVSVGTLEWVQRHGAQLDAAGQQRLQDSSGDVGVNSGGGQHEPLTGHTQVYVGVDGVVVGRVDVADMIRPDARSTVQELHQQGISTVMLSGTWLFVSVFAPQSAGRALAARAGQQLYAELRVHVRASVCCSSPRPAAGLRLQHPTRGAVLAASSRATGPHHASAVCCCVTAGDRQEAAVKVAAAVGIAPSDVHAGIKPAGKAALVEQLKASGRRVAMVGDGINDTAALAAADVGMAMAGGVDAASDVAKVVLMGDQLHQVGCGGTTVTVVWERWRLG